MGKGMGCGSPQTLPYTTGTITAQNFSCWKKCNSLNSFHCSWSPLGPAGNTSYSLNLCWQHKGCSQFDAHKMTNYKLPHHKLYILNNAVAWVEASWEGHVHRTPNITFVFNEVEKPDPPPSRVPFSKTDGQLRLRVPRPQCPRMDQPAEREARSWRAGDSGWTQFSLQVECMTVMVKDEDDSVNCTLKGNGTFVVQLRQKTWSSYWSDWSSNISVPEEILESPVLSHQLEKLGRDGQRVLRLSWQPVLKGQRDVNYTLHAHMPACGCAELDEEDVVVLGWEVREHNLTLSGAEYEILLRAVNAAGPGPASQLHVPAEQHRDLSFKDVSVAGSTVTAQWEAPIPGEAYCFEQQVLAEAPQQGVCIQEEFPAKSIHVEKGALGAPACHRLAVHGWDPERGWATFALWHHYANNGSLAVPIDISSGDAGVVLQWKPSPHAACPGVLAKYLICHMAERDNVTYSEADATAVNYTLENLQPGTAYRVGVWEVTKDSEGTCSAWKKFQTKALGPQGAVWRANLKYLGISLSVPVMAAIYHLTKKRARHLLFPPLPKPVGTNAIQFSASEKGQGQTWIRLLEPSERFNPAELLLTELNPSKETTDTTTQTDVPRPSMPQPNVSQPSVPQSSVPQPNVPQPSPVTEKPEEVLVVCPPGCEEEMTFAYRRQEMLSPVGFPPPGSTSCTGHPLGEEEEEEEEGRQGLCQPLIPIALLISNKSIVIRDQEGWNPSPEKSVP
ncbi:interleukin-12 receptor subunit beta-1 [Chiroxiphia lanceolata]|uniref:interleukin-12 receptor subunit beta-1 n=1 Tax=Chiroxiphia lanceolata TaxID=296741 RepID=UPI0013CE7D8F|nr:interleukin-12 receptor subunit beta-1 [Chiroxiphia lanceolata]